MTNRSSTSVLALLAVAGLGLGIGLAGCDQSGSDSYSGSEATPVAKQADADAVSTPGPAGQPSALTARAVDDPTNLDGALAAAGTDPAKTVTPVDPKLTSRKLGDTADPATSRPVRQPPSPAVDPATFPVKIDPPVLNLGAIPVSEVGRGKVKLVNTGDEPVMLNQCKTSCGCTTANCPKGKYIEPGEEVEIEVTLKGGTTARPLKKKVTFVFNEDDRLLMDVTGEAVSYVSIDPLYIVPDRVPDGKVTVKSDDGEAFLVTSMTPPVLTEDQLPSEPAEEHVLHLDWDRWKELGSERKVTFFLNHSKAERVSTTVREISRPRTPGDPAEKTRSLPFVAVERAIKEGNVEAVLERLDAGTVKLEQTDRQGQSLLHLAAKFGQPELIQALLDKGADVDAKDTNGRTSIMAAAQAKNPAVTRTLLDAGASLEPRDLVGSALSWFAAFGDAESTRMIVEAGAELEIVGQATGYTPLIWASGFGEAGSVEALIEAGANIEAADLPHGATPLMHASRTGGDDSVEKIGILLEGGAQLEARDASGKTPLLIASENSGARADMVEALIAAGADVRARDSRGQTAWDLVHKRTDARREAVIEILRPYFEEAGAADGGEGDGGE